MHFIKSNISAPQNKFTIELSTAFNQRVQNMVIEPT